MIKLRCEARKQCRRNGISSDVTGRDVARSKGRVLYFMCCSHSGGKNCTCSVTPDAIYGRHYYHIIISLLHDDGVGGRGSIPTIHRTIRYRIVSGHRKRG